MIAACSTSLKVLSSRWRSTSPANALVHSRSLYQPSSRRDVGCHLWIPPGIFLCAFLKVAFDVSANALSIQGPSIGPAAAETSAATCGFHLVFSSRWRSTSRRTHCPFKVPLSAQQPPRRFDLTHRSPSTTLRARTSAATCASAFGTPADMPAAAHCKLLTAQ